MKLGRDTASMTNFLMSGTKGAPTPKVGMGATLLMWTDRKAGTIVKVTPTQVHFREDKAIRIGETVMSDQQDYRYEPDESAPVKIYRLRKDGRYHGDCGCLRIGERVAYHDYSF